MIIQIINGNIKIEGLYLNARMKSNFKMANPALVIPHPGQGKPVINLIGQLGILNIYVMKIYSAKSRSGIYVFLINLINIFRYSFMLYE